MKCKARQKKRKSDPTCEMDSVIQAMQSATKTLSELSDTQEYSLEATDRLEGLRHEAIKMKMEIEAIFEILTNTNPIRGN